MNSIQQQQYTTRLDSISKARFSEAKNTVVLGRKKIPSASLEKDPNSEMSSVLKDKPNFHKPRKERT